MKFKQMRTTDYSAYISNLYLDRPVDNGWMYGSVFWSVVPITGIPDFPLKRLFKPSATSNGLHTEVLGQLQQKFANPAREKVLRNGLYGRSYFSDEGSFKLHISLNNIGELDASVIEGLSKHLIDRARSATNMSFQFKMLKPEALSNDNNDRFKDNDQFTLYFDKYSSVEELMSLCDEVNNYLCQQIPENKIQLGPKDIIGFNSFVSGRFDTDKLNAQYNVYQFYDEQLKQFFQRYKGRHSLLSNVPLCVFEVVFNNILIDNAIEDLNADTFNQRYGSLVQKQLDLIVKEPQKYTKNPELLIIDSNPDLSKEYQSLSDEEKTIEILKHRLSQLKEHSQGSQEFNKKIDDINLKLNKPINNEINLNDLRGQIIDLKSFEDNFNKTEEKSLIRCLIDRIISIFNWFISLFTPPSKIETKPSKVKSTLFQDTIKNNFEDQYLINHIKQ